MKLTTGLKLIALALASFVAFDQFQLHSKSTLANPSPPSSPPSHPPAGITAENRPSTLPQMTQESEDMPWLSAMEATEQQTAPPQFRCDGRTRCTQMRSCEEAVYFLINCPSTAMDGDHDGIPCESQWCEY